MQFNFNILRTKQQQYKSGASAFDWRKDPVINAAVKQIEPMQIDPADKTRLAKFVAEKRFALSAYLAANFQCGIVSVKVQANRIGFGINPHTSFVKRLLAASNEVSHATRSTATVKMLDGGKLAVVIDTPFGVKVPTFKQLVNDGAFKPGKFLFGYVDGQPRFGAWQDVLNIIVAGLSQSGKTTTTRFLLAQAAINGAKFVIVDPHSFAGDKALTHGLNLPMLAPVAVDRADWLKAIAYVDAIGAKRIRGDKDRTPVLLVIDEANSLFDDKEIMEPLSLLLKEIVRAYSKVGVNALCIAHDWRASSTGGSATLRDLFQSRYVHRLPRSSARMLISNDYAEAIEKQAPGNAHLSFANGDVCRVVVPMTTDSDINAIGRMVAGSGSTFSTLAFDQFCYELAEEQTQTFDSFPSLSATKPKENPMEKLVQSIGDDFILDDFDMEEGRFRSRAKAIRLLGWHDTTHYRTKLLEFEQYIFAQSERFA